MIASGIIVIWTYLIYELSSTMLYDSNADVVKEMTEAQQKHMYVGAKGLIRMTSIPMSVLSVMWMIAFVSERREHNRLRKLSANKAFEGNSSR